MINIDEFKKVDIVVGQILTVEKIPNTDKLLKLSVDLGPILIQKAKDESPISDVREVQLSSFENSNETKQDVRQIVSGISSYFPDISVLVGKKCMFIANLEPRMIRGFESQGMIMALSTEDGKFSLLSPSDDIPVGTRAK